MKVNRGWFQKGKKRHWTETHKKNHKLAFTQYKNKQHWNWAGNKVGYKALHQWLSRNFGKPNKCDKCLKTKDIEWASKQGNYTRDRNQWLWLCKSCHRKYDKSILNIKKMR